MNDLVTSIVRTITPMIVGTLITAAAAVGLDVETEQQASLTVIVAWLITGLYYGIARRLEQHSSGWGWLLGKPATLTYVRGDLPDDMREPAGVQANDPPQDFASPDGE